MIIGDAERFAIIFEVNDPSDRWLFGKLAYSVSGALVGDFSRGCSLNVGAASFRELIRLSGQRFDADLFAQPATIAFQQINDALYVDRGQTLAEVVRDKYKYWRFHAFPTGFDVFDFYKCYLVEYEDRARLLWTNVRSVPLHVCEQVLHQGEFDAVVRDFLEYMKSTFANGREGKGGITDY